MIELIEKISKLFSKDYTKNEYFMRNLITPDKDSWSHKSFSIFDKDTED